jgi:hypothetical protein
MKPQSAILDPVPNHARHLFFDLDPATDQGWCPPMVGNAVHLSALA